MAYQDLLVIFRASFTALRSTYLPNATAVHVALVEEAELVQHWQYVLL